MADIILFLRIILFLDGKGDLVTKNIWREGKEDPGGLTLTSGAC